MVSPPGFTTRVLADPSRFTIVTVTVVVCPAVSELALKLMVRASGSGFWIVMPETGPPCAVSVNEPATPRCNVSAVVDAVSVPATGPSEGATETSGRPAGGEDGGPVAVAPAARGMVPGRDGEPAPADALGAAPGGPGDVTLDRLEGPAGGGPVDCGAWGPCRPYMIPAAATATTAAPALAVAAWATGPWTRCGGSSGLGNPDRPNGPARLITPAR